MWSSTLREPHEPGSDTRPLTGTPGGSGEPGAGGRLRRPLNGRGASTARLRVERGENLTSARWSGACEAVKNEDGEATSGTESLFCRLPEAWKSHRKDHYVCGAGTESVAVSSVTAPPEDILLCGLSTLVIAVPQK